MLDFLFFAAHPDDAEIFCGGTVSRLVSQNYKVGIIDLTKGELSTRGTVEIRAKETHEATKILNIHHRSNLGIADGNIDNTQENRIKIEEAIREQKPKIVFVPYNEDRHPDHINASKVVTEACFYSGLVKIETKHPAFRPKSVIYYFSHVVREPSFIVDISDYLETKIKAIKAFKSQFFNPDSTQPETFISNKRFIESIEGRARYFGHQIGVEYGEPFFVKSKIKINNIYEIFS
jgi:bacillithiol biosynthesis deacetylase BshB1